MEENKLDRIFKNTLGEYQSNIDKNELWNQVNKPLVEKPKNRFGLFFIILIAVAILFAAFWQLGVLDGSYKNTEPNTSSQLNDHLDTKSEESAVFSKEKNESFSQELIENNSFSSKNKQDQLDPNKKTESRSTTDYNSKSPDPNTTLVVQNEKKLTSQNPVNRNSSSQINTSPINEELNNSPVNSENANLQTVSKSINRPVEDKSLSEQIKNSASESNQITRKAIVTKSNPSNKLKSNSDINFSKNSEDEAASLNKRISVLETLELTQIKTSPETTLEFSNYVRNRKSSKFSIGAELSAYKPIRSLKGTTSEDLEWAEQRESNERMLDGYEFNIYSKYIKNGYFVKAGISLYQYNEEFSPGKFSETVTQTGTGPVEIVIGSDGSPLDTIMGEIEIEKTTTRDLIIYNRYRSVNVNITLGYQKYIRRWGYAIDGGIGYSLKAFSSGQILKGRELIEVKSVMRNSHGFNLLVNPRVMYKLNSSVSLLAGPYARFNISNSLNSEVSLVQKYTHLGLSIGLEYRL